MRRFIRRPGFSLLFLGVLIATIFLGPGRMIIISGLGNIVQICVVKVIERNTNIATATTDSVAPVIDHMISARLLLIEQRYPDAARWLMPYRRYAPDSPFLFQDLIIALGNSGQPQEVRALYEANPKMLRDNRQVMDAIAGAYLETSADSDTMSLLRARAARPDDLYINYVLWRNAEASHDAMASAVYRDSLSRFTVQAIESTNATITRKIGEVAPILRSEGIWDHDVTSNVASVLVWRYPESPAVETLLQEMITRYPQEPQWLFYLAEMYERRNDLAASEAIYQRVLEVDPGYAKAFLRLGMIAWDRANNDSTTRRRFLQEAYDWLEQYHRIYPDDVVGFEMLAHISESLGSASAVQLRTELDALADDRAFVAEIFGIPTDTVSLGLNLVKNGALLDWHDMSPDGWATQEYLGQDNQSGAYALGKDIVSPGRSSARIATLRGGVLPDKTLCFAEYFGDQFSIPRGDYLISILYSADRFSHDSAVLAFLGDNTHPGGYKLLEKTMPTKDGQWRLERFLVHSEAEMERVGPLLRVWGNGQLQILSFSVRPIHLDNQ